MQNAPRVAESPHSLCFMLMVTKVTMDAPLTYITYRFGKGMLFSRAGPEEREQAGIAEHNGPQLVVDRTIKQRARQQKHDTEQLASPPSSY
eukprot:1160994-Pelagomonas_calceolata.AAC.4